MNKFILFFIFLFLISCNSYNYVAYYKKSGNNEEMILDRAIKGEEHILTIILSNSLKGSYIYIAGESLDYKTYTSYYKGKLIKCELKKCHILKVNNKQAIDLTINNEKIVVCSGQSYLYKYLIVEKGRKNGIILKYTNILKY